MSIKKMVSVKNEMRNRLNIVNEYILIFLVEIVELEDKIQHLEMVLDSNDYVYFTDGVEDRKYKEDSELTWFELNDVKQNKEDLLNALFELYVEKDELLVNIEKLDGVSRVANHMRFTKRQSTGKKIRFITRKKKALFEPVNPETNQPVSKKDVDLPSFSDLKLFREKISQGKRIEKKFKERSEKLRQKQFFKNEMKEEALSCMIDRSSDSLQKDAQAFESSSGFNLLHYFKPKYSKFDAHDDFLNLLNDIENGIPEAEVKARDLAENFLFSIESIDEALHIANMKRVWGFWQNSLYPDTNKVYDAWDDFEESEDSEASVREDILFDEEVI